MLLGFSSQDITKNDRKISFDGWIVSFLFFAVKLIWVRNSHSISFHICVLPHVLWRNPHFYKSFYQTANEFYAFLFIVFTASLRLHILFIRAYQKVCFGYSSVPVHFPLFVIYSHGAICCILHLLSENVCTKCELSYIASASDIAAS